MKKIKNTIKNLFIIFIATVSSISFAYAQNASNDKKEAKKINIENSVKNKSFKFVAQTVIPQRGGTRTLTSLYDLKVSKDTLQSYLPYFGRAFVAPINSNQGALDFTSTDFEYKVTDRKKGGWDINILSNDQSGERFLLSVFENGSATLQVTSNNRSSISFFGYVKER